MPMFLSLNDRCCKNCALCQFSSDLGYYCINNDDGIYIKNPFMVFCPTYIEKQNKSKESKNMIASPFKEVSVPKTVFNEDYWKVGDAYVIKKHDEKPKFYVLEIVIEMSYVKMNNGVTISVEEFHNGNYELINHISLDYACSKSMAEE